jgi:hypothetical protein
MQKWFAPQVGRIGLVQSVLVKQPTQTLVAVSQTVANVPMQLVFVRHSTQRIEVVLQTRGLVHWALLVHDTTQRLVAVSQTRPASPQSLVFTHCTQRFVVVLQ